MYTESTGPPAAIHLALVSIQNKAFEVESGQFRDLII
jgi:hypothetical protein